MSPKFAPRLRARAIWKSKSLKADGVGAFLEVEVGKICTTPARESDLEVKIVKADGVGAVLEVEVSRLRASAIWKPKSLKHRVLGPLLEVQSLFRMAGAGISTQHPHKNR